MGPAIVGVDRDGAGDCRATAAGSAVLPGERRVDFSGVGADLLTVDKSDKRSESDERE